MPRQAKWVAAGIYQPTYEPRHAYGPRRQGRCELIEDFLRSTACDLLDAKTVARYSGALGAICEQVDIPMPRGGVRRLLICPRCQGRTQWLYGVDHPMYRRIVYGCRACWGLSYQSQYAGRRLEAHPNYLKGKLHRQIAATPRDVSADPNASRRRRCAMFTHQQRMRRYDQAQALSEARLSRYIARRELALALAMLILLVREVNRENREWQRRILPATLRADAAARAAVAAMPDTPDWARQIILDSLDSLHAAQETPQESSQRSAKAAEKHAEDAAAVCEARETGENTSETAQLAHLLAPERIADLRAQYAALGQARKVKRAA